MSRSSSSSSRRGDGVGGGSVCVVSVWCRCGVVGVVVFSVVEATVVLVGAGGDDGGRDGVDGRGDGSM